MSMTPRRRQRHALRLRPMRRRSKNEPETYHLEFALSYPQITMDSGAHTCDRLLCGRCTQGRIGSVRSQSGWNTLSCITHRTIIVKHRPPSFQPSSLTAQMLFRRLLLDPVEWRTRSAGATREISKTCLKEARQDIRIRSRTRAVISPTTLMPTDALEGLRSLSC